jgi:myosin heavy subunit
MDVDVEGVLEGRTKLNRDLLTHVCQAQISSKQPESTDPIHIAHLWRVTQVLLETTVHETSRFSQRAQLLEQHLKGFTETHEQQVKALNAELDQVKKENSILKGETPGIMPCEGPPPVEAHHLSTEEGKALQEKIRKMQEQYTTMMKQKTAIAEELQKLKEAQSTVVVSSSSSSSSHASTPKEKELEDELQNMRIQLVEKQKERDELNRSVEGKLSESSQFRSLKTMLSQKNELVKELREKLRKYETAAAELSTSAEPSADDDD